MGQLGLFVWVLVFTPTSVLRMNRLKCSTIPSQIDGRERVVGQREGRGEVTLIQVALVSAATW